MSSLLLLFIFVPVLTGILLALNLLLAVHRPDDSKVSAYECGFSPIYGQTRSPFHVQFYIVGILFLIFDLEILLIYPICVTLYQVSSYGFWIVMIFFAILTVGFVLEIGSGALYFTDQKTSVSDLRPKDISQTPPLSNLPQWSILGLVLISFPELSSLLECLEPMSCLTLLETPIYLAAPLICKEATKDNEVDNTTKSYFQLVTEKDEGQDTENVYLLAKRHIVSGAPTDANVINQYLSEFSLSITQEELEILTDINKIEFELPLDKTSESVIEVLGRVLPKSHPDSVSNRFVGVYIITNKLTGEQYVGSSINLGGRIRRYFSPSVLAQENRSISKSLLEKGI